MKANSKNFPMSEQVWTGLNSPLFFSQMCALQLSFLGEWWPPTQSRSPGSRQLSPMLRLLCAKAHLSLSHTQHPHACHIKQEHKGCHCPFCWCIIPKWLQPHLSPNKPLCKHWEPGSLVYPLACSGVVHPGVYHQPIRRQALASHKIKNWLELRECCNNYFLGQNIKGISPLSHSNRLKGDNLSLTHFPADNNP